MGALHDHQLMALPVCLEAVVHPVKDFALLASCEKLHQLVPVMMVN